MVFLTSTNFVRSIGPDQFWKRRKILKLAAHFVGRRRNCFSLAIRGVHRALFNCSYARKLKKQDMADLWRLRIQAGAMEHGVPYPVFRASLNRCNILLNRKVLADLAIWEPRTFKALADIAKNKAVDDRLKGYETIDKPSHVITRGLLPKFEN